MKINHPFPNGHSYFLEHSKTAEARGVICADLKGKRIVFKPITEIEVLEIREIIAKEIKKQNDCIARGEEY